MHRVALSSQGFQARQPIAMAAMAVVVLMVLSGGLVASVGPAFAAPTHAASLASAAPPATASAAPRVSLAGGPSPAAGLPATSVRTVSSAAPVSVADLTPSPGFVAPAATTPVFTVGPTTGFVGTMVTFNATGFADTSAFTISYTSSAAKLVTACSGTTTNKGVFSCTYVIPPEGAGARVFTGADAKGHSQPATFTVKPELLSNPSSGLVGTSITLQGTGFGGQVKKGQAIQFSAQISWSGGSVCKNVLTSVLGGFNCTYTLPPVPSGPHSFTGLDNASNTASATFTIIAGLSVGPTYGPGGTIVTFTGTGFHASSNINVTWPEGTACTAIRTQGTGGFSCSFEIPPTTPGGGYNFTAKDNSSIGHPGIDSASVPYVVTFVKDLPGGGLVGAPVTLTGGGFAPSKPYTIDFNGAVVCGGGSSTTSPFGTISCSILIPPAVAGVHPFVATDSVGDRASTPFVVAPGLSLSPSYGAAATNVTFTGTGFAPNVSVTVSWVKGTACSRTTSPVGGFSCSATLPAGIPGASYTFTATDSALNTASGVFVVTFLALNPASGPVGTAIGVTGGGYPASVGFTIGWGENVVCSGTTSSTGSFTQSSCGGAPFTAPEVPAGTYVLKANVSSTTVATANFTVTPALKLPAKSQVNATIAISGTGFGDDAAVSLSWAGGVACPGLLANVLGAFSCSYKIPAIYWGSYVVTASDNMSHTATAVLSIAPLLTIGPTSGPVGTTINVTGAGFAPNSALSVVWTDGLVCSRTTNAAGSFGCTYVIPPIPEPSKSVIGYTFTAADASSHNATATFRVAAHLTESPSFGPPGTVVTLVGSGYPANTIVKANWSGLGAPVCSAKSSSTGGVSCSFAVPAVPANAYTIQMSAGQTTPQLTFTVTALLTVAPTRGPVGTLVTLQGAGFVSEGTVTVTLGATTACSLPTLATGSFSCTFRVPAIPYGIHSFAAADGFGDSASATFTVLPQLALSPMSGPVGTQVTFNGSGYPANAGVTVTWASGAICSATTTGTGSFSCAAAMPPATVGPHAFTAKNDSSSSASANFTVTPGFSATPSSGLVGTTVQFVGTGFAASVSVSVSWAGGTVCTNTTTAVGGFGCTFTIPTSTPGSAYLFTATDANGNTAVATFTVTTTLTATPGHGIVGTSVVFAGSGYGKSITVTVSWSGGTACTATSSAGGAFTCTFAIPGGTAGGSYLFTSLDTNGNTASATFVVTFLTVNPTGGTAGTSVVFTAGGFNPTSAISITWTDGTACTGTTTTVGTFTCGYTIPALTAAAKYTFTASDGGGETATVFFTVFGIPSVSAPTPGHSAADVGQTIAFTTTATGGSGTYTTYTWYESSALFGCTLANAPTISCTPTGAGTFNVSVKVTDSNGVSSSYAASGKVVVSPALAISTPTLNVTSSDVGQPISFSTTVSGGSGGLTFVWSGLPVGCSGTAQTIVCSPTAPVANTSVTAKVTDSNGGTATSLSLLVTIYPDPTVRTPSASRPGADVGQTVTFSTTGTGGRGPLMYVWTGLPAGCSGGGPVVRCAPTAPVSGTSITVSLTDANGFEVTSGGLTFTVTAPPVVSTPVPSRASVDLGQSVTFNVTASGGFGSLTYAWSGLPAGCSGTAASIACTPTAVAAGLSVTVTVTDGNDFNVTSAALTFSVFADPVASAPTPNPTGVDLNQLFHLTANVAGGSGGLSFVWTGLPAGCTGTTATIACTITNASEIGGYVIGYTVTDSNHRSSTSATIAFTVSSDPSVSTPAANRSSADVGQSVAFSTTASGGAGSLTFVWRGLPSGCAGSAAVVDCTVAVPVAPTSINVTVTDANGYSVTSAFLLFSVYADPHVGEPSANVTSADVGQAVAFNTSVVGGSGGFSFVWTNLPPGCAGTTMAIDCASVSTAGTYDISVVLTDSNGVKSASGVLSFTVDPDPTVAAPGASHGSVDVGQSDEFTAAPAGGAGGYSYAWSGLPSGCTGTDTATVDCTPTAALASTTVTVTVTDANGYSVTSAPTAFSVDAALSVTLSESSSSFLKGGQVKFTVTTTGGSGGLSYAWTGLPAGCSATTSSATVTCTPSASGSFSVSVTVTDSNGGSAKGAVSLSVNPSFLGLPASEGIALLAVGILAAVVVAIVLTVMLVRRRRRGSNAPLPWAPSPSSPSSPAPVEPSWSPPTAVPPPEPAAPPPSDEPSPWELPPPEAGGDDAGSYPPSGQ